MSSQTIFVKAGATSQTRDISLVQNAGATSPGNAITGLAYNTSSLTAYYRNGATGTVTAITLATQTVGGAYSSGGFVEASATNMPGLYRLDIPNAAIPATPGVCSTITFTGAASLATHHVYLVGSMFVDVDTIKTNPVVNGGTVTFPTGATLASTTNITAGTVTTATNVTTLSSGAISEASFATTAGTFNPLGIIDQGTAQAATGTTLQLRSATSFDADSEIVGSTVLIATASTGAGQSRVITAYTNSTDTATVDAWTTTPTGTITYKVFASPPASAANPVPADLRKVMGNAFTGSTKPYTTSA